MALLAILYWQLDTQPYPLHMCPSFALDKFCESLYVGLGFESQPLKQFVLKEVPPVLANSGEDGELICSSRQPGLAVSGPCAKFEDHVLDLAW